MTLTGKATPNVIKFHTCPIGHHKGEWWSKLDDKDFCKLAYLQDCKLIHSKELDGEMIRWDTFDDWTPLEFESLLKHLYGYRDVVLIYLDFYHPDGGFTTLRGYTHKKWDYYKRLVGKEFRVLLLD